MRKVIPLEERFWAKVSQTDGCWYWTAATMVNGYGKFGPKLAHRVAYEMCIGPIPSGMVIDHRCFTRHCVRPDHLRLATYSQNMQHRNGLDANNTSGHRGVSWHKDKLRWRAYVKKDDVYCHLGYFDTEHEAALVALGARLAIHTHNDLDREAIA